MTTRTDDSEPVTLTLKAGDWHLILREITYCATSLENMAANIANGVDPRRDAWVLAALQPMAQAVAAADRAYNLLADAQARPVPQ